MTEQELWHYYLKNHPEEKRSYVAWSFGLNSVQADELAKIVLDGTKTATASSYDLYEIDNNPLPRVGDLNIILNSHEEGVCITETTRVSISHFHEATDRQAYLEGEGDRSLAYWKEVHEKFFREEFTNYELEFSEDILIVCEEFKVILIANQ